MKHDLSDELNKNQNINSSIDSITDELLVQRSQDGSAIALEALVRRWQSPLWRHAVRTLRDTSFADDVLQESLIVIARKIHTLSDPKLFKAWAYQIVSHKAADFIRKQQRIRKIASTVSKEEKEVSSYISSEDTAVDIIRAAIQRLNDNDKLILSLFYLEEMNITEVSHICSIPPGTVKSRLFKARENLKKILNTHFKSND